MYKICYNSYVACSGRNEKIGKSKVEEFKLTDKRVSIRENQKNGPVFLWGMYPHREDEEEHMWNCLMEVVSDQGFVLVTYEVDDWNKAFSPWKALAAFGSEPFAGGAQETLRWIEDILIPEVHMRLGMERKIFLAGYSLAGLFSLWAVYEKELFDGVVCCSGSLWYPDWDKYVSDKKIGKACSVYLSLGDKEERTKNRMMKQVGDRTRTQETLLEKDPQVLTSTLEWNKGGHFEDSGIRLAKGIKWILQTAKSI